MAFPTGAEMASEMFGFDTPQKLSEWQEQYDASMSAPRSEPSHQLDPSAGLKLASIGAKAKMHPSVQPEAEPGVDDGYSMDF